MSMPGDELPASDQMQSPIEAMQAQEMPKPKRRLRSVTVDREAIADRLSRFYQDDLEARSADRIRRAQRWAKFRGWTEDKTWPWIGASNIALPDMLEKSLRTQDTLHNAVMTSRPNVFNAKANIDANKGKEDVIDKLIDFQLFVEGQGETRIGEMIDAYVNDGVFTTLVQWVRQKGEVSERIEFPYPGPNEDFFMYLQGIVQSKFEGMPDVNIQQSDEEGWEWTADLGEDERQYVCFYTEEDESSEQKVLCIIKKYVVTHDGPVMIPFDYDDVIAPAGVSNLQIPGPANHGGAPHVLLRSYPTVGEIRELMAEGYYDLLTQEDLEKIKPEFKPSSEHIKKDQTDRLQGQQNWKQPFEKSHGTVTRLLCFDRFDLDGDGLDEDVVFWFLPESKVVCRARMLSEVFPAKVPRRPLAEATFIPVAGRREGVSLLEMQEGMHDMQKTLFDIACDSATLGAMPVFFYRMSGSMKPENLQVFPGMGVPVGDPQRDIMFPNMANNNSLGMVMNLISMSGNWGDRATVIGDFQLGRVPTGKSSALRTTGAVSMLQAQGDARPERILRRLFIGLGQIWSIVHELNCAFLPKKKQIRISGLKRPDEDPFMTIDGRDAIDGIYDFDFQANAFNTSKQNLQQALMQYGSALLSPIAVQTGIVNPDKIYALFRDMGKSLGLQPDNYLNPPSPEASLPPISAEDVITSIMAGTQPYGKPAEPMEEHIQKLGQFYNDDTYGMLTQPQTKVFESWVMQVVQRYQQQQQQQALAQAAAAYQAQAQQGQTNANGGGGGGDPTAGNPPVSSGNELMDESLPTAGGGAAMAAE